jgi:hypothetical protein
MSPLSPLLLLAALSAPAATPPSSEAVRAGHDAFRRAGIPLYTVIDQADKGMRWSVQNVADFGPLVGAASEAVRRLHQQYPSAVADAYGNGTMTNMEDTAKMFGGGNLERGCISHQSVTYDALKPLLVGKSLTVSKIRYGLPPLQHNAVIVFPNGTDWMYTGVVFDGWLRQKSDPDKMTYLYAPWGPIRPIWGVHVEPRYWKANVRLIGENE